MGTRLGHRAMRIAAFFCLLVAGHAGSANAQVATKEIVIYNNSKTETIYPMLQTPAMTFSDNPDIWLQGFFAVPNIFTQTFLAAFNYEAFINIDHGIAPGHFVSVTIPFYTQLKAPGAGGVGATSDEYIDWWNAARLFLFDSHTAATGAYYFVNTPAPPPVTPYPGNAAALPSCIDDNMVTCPVNVLAYNAVPINNIPFQLVEYTFANYGPPHASGMPPKLLETQKVPPYLNQYRIDFDVGAVDAVYLPVAAAPLHNNTFGYLGTVLSVSEFRTKRAYPVDTQDHNW